MDTKSWGPHAWNYLHYVSFNFPQIPQKDDIDKYIIFKSTGNSIPQEIGETQSNPDSYAVYLYLLSIVFYT